MGLKKLLTNLDNRTVSDITLKSKSIGYPNDNIDTPPLIGRVSWDLNDKNANPTFLLGKDHNKGGLDGGGLRGGIATNINRRHVDNQRISAFLGDSIFQWPLNVSFPSDYTPTQNTLNSSATDPSAVAAESGIDLTWSSPLGLTSAGQQFKWRQIGLQRMNPKINAPMEGLLGFSPANQRTYVPVSTKTAVRLAGVSQIKREGTTLGLFGNGYVDDKDFLENSNKNRLIYLYDKNILTNPTEEPGFFDKVGAFASNVMNFIGGKGEMLYDYNGGPNSVFGIGRTFIGRYTNTNPNGVINPYGIGEDNVTYIKKKAIEFEGDKFTNTSFPNIREKKYGEVKLTNKTSKYIYKEGNSNDKIAGENVYNLAFNPDKINNLNIFKTTDGSDWEKELMGKGTEDFIPFQFEVVDIDNPLQSTKMVFRAYIDSITDDFSATHNSVKYSGRAEKFYTYNEFDRKIAISFKIAAQSRVEMEPIYRKLNYLVAQTAPNYKGTRMRTPYMKLTVGDWFNRLPGVLSSVNLNWSKDYPWEIKYDEEGQDKDMLRLPHVLDVSLSFLPIHKMRPESNELFTNEKVEGKNAMAAFIGIDKWLKYGSNDFTEINEDLTPSNSDVEMETLMKMEDSNNYEEYKHKTRDTGEENWTDKFNKFKENLSSKGAVGTIKDTIKK